MSNEPSWEAYDRTLRELRAVRLREIKAEAWDEGHRFTGFEPAPGENPYRDAP